jgi:hypothetical protein
LAQRLAAEGLSTDAEEWYREIVAKHPATAAANEARKLLGLPLRQSPGESVAANEQVPPAERISQLSRPVQRKTTDPEPQGPADRR